MTDDEDRIGAIILLGVLIAAGTVVLLWQLLEGWNPTPPPPAPVHPEVMAWTPLQWPDAGPERPPVR